MIKQAIILSAGLGTRLRPLTDVVPKPMIPLLGKPMLEWNIEQFKMHGVSEFFINLHYLPDVIRDYCGDGSKWGVKIRYSFEPEILGTAGGLRQFKNDLDGTFYLMYGDMISLVDYTKMTEHFSALSDPVGMQRVEKTDAYIDADVAELDEHSRFIAIHPKPHARRYPNAYRMRGIFILKKELLEYVPPGGYFEIGKDLLPEVVRHEKNFYGYECDEYSKGIDTMEKYKEVEVFLKTHKHES